MKTPPGYITRARAEHLNAMFVDGVRAIGYAMSERVAPLIFGQTDEAVVRRILEEHVEVAKRELERLQYEIVALIDAPEH